MFRTQFINSWGFVTEYVSGDTRAEMADKIKARYTFEDGWTLRPKVFKDNPNPDLTQHNFWELTNSNGYSYYGLYVEELDPRTNQPIRK